MHYQLQHPYAEWLSPGQETAASVTGYLGFLPLSTAIQSETDILVISSDALSVAAPICGVAITWSRDSSLFPACGGSCIKASSAAAFKCPLARLLYRASSSTSSPLEVFI